MIFQCYKLLNVHPLSTDEEIKAAHRIHSRATHPDRDGGDERKFHDIQVAFRQIRSMADRRNTRMRLMGLGGQCPICIGRGYSRRALNFTRSVVVPCERCGHCGYISRKG